MPRFFFFYIQLHSLNRHVKFLKFTNYLSLLFIFFFFWNRKRNSQACQVSSVLVYDGTPHGSVLLGSLCETETRSFISSSNSISIVYSSYNGGQDLEFSASYDSVVSNNNNGTFYMYSKSKSPII